MRPINLQILEMLRPAVLEEMDLQENALFDLCPKVTRNIAQYRLYYAIYVHAPERFEIATFNCLGGDTFTRNTLFDL